MIIYKCNDVQWIVAALGLLPKKPLKGGCQPNKSWQLFLWRLLCNMYVSFHFVNIHTFGRFPYNRSQPLNRQELQLIADYASNACSIYYIDVQQIKMHALTGQVSQANITFYSVCVCVCPCVLFSPPRNQCVCLCELRKSSAYSDPCTCASRRHWSIYHLWRVETFSSWKARAEATL